MFFFFKPRDMGKSIGYIPSGNQTWHAGKSSSYFDDVPT